MMLEESKVREFATERFDAYCKRLGIDNNGDMDFFEYDKFHESPEFEDNRNEDFTVLCGEGSGCSYHFSKWEIESIRLDAYANRELDWYEFMNIVKYGIYPKIQYVQDYID